ncbi:hypothetical protein FVE85_5305 [Porphyridium purpureum]|uniref:Uncharacterized protein n=1 Tax=Porphyridium purpureum TaxID=35688 RepID=A0A5J4Z365_PORPP|nr:Chain 53, LPP2 [Porphyridium purpureum]7Y4L_Y3 Chain Y3, LPP2 [Porphyridium purpureum]7Y5E_53 Chain 53, LPP2 [Porphyridium purpureum]7Y5E_Y3 Chain Y3, LPP2 [Porphyridium purpureum]7Y7A_5B Chain 5B, LPP2 [Porphyridium purpureum]7Y7A_5d Chain 5d, LPP2 [Porphyridium purpureum]7Y7A_YB Chain YB, LPP2 [Porphyridium purpureum]7Y7A_Yd Chain Yd, LPP2 [Porphyridium purpureum]KAA8497720.1 hypothetical protein FVE85_5305 [Porphyridium purpureum]|eukprot:POR9852..scf295_1
MVVVCASRKSGRAVVPAMVPALRVELVVSKQMVMGLAALFFQVQRTALMAKLELPKFSMPSMPSMPKLTVPKLQMPKLGGGEKKDKAAKPSPSAPKTTIRPSGGVKVRAAVGNKSNVDAPSFKGSNMELADSGADYKAFPKRRMPGANMQGFLDMAKGMKPK